MKIIDKTIKDKNIDKITDILKTLFKDENNIELIIQSQDIKIMLENTEIVVYITDLNDLDWQINYYKRELEKNKLKIKVYKYLKEKYKNEKY